MASVAEERRVRTLLVDTDTQGNLTSSFLTDAAPGVEHLFDPTGEPDLAEHVQSTPHKFIDLIPCGPALAPLDVSNEQDWEQADLQFSIRDALLPIRDQYDLVVINCPPRLSLASYAALRASEGVVIPMEAADWGAQGIMQVTQAVRLVQNRRNPDLKLLGYLVSRFKRARQYQRSYLAHSIMASWRISMPSGLYRGLHSSFLARCNSTQTIDRYAILSCPFGIHVKTDDFRPTIVMDPKNWTGQ